MYLILLILASIVAIIVCTTKFSIHPFLVLVVVAFLFGISANIPTLSVIDHINTGFGGTIGKIGIVILLGIMIGTFLENTGAAHVIANKILHLVGIRRIHLGLSIIGYVVCIPVFADSGFIILSSLNKSLSKKTGYSLAGTTVALSMGLLATHTMVPPTPGPIAAAGIIGADLGLVILLGLAASVSSLIVTTTLSKKLGQMVNIRMPESPKQENQGESQIGEGPSAIKSFLPIVIPILLIVLKSIAEYPTRPFGDNIWVKTFEFLGSPVIALFIGLFLAFFLPKKFDKSMLSTSGWVGNALTSAATIILITGAGGAFGAVLQQSGVSDVISESVSSNSFGIWLPFIIAAALKSAQGSSTVAIVTTAALVAPLMPDLGHDTEAFKAMVVVAIGAGSAVVSHANDSFFWVVTQMSGMSVKQGYLLQSLASAVLGISAMLFLSLINFLLHWF